MVTYIDNLHCPYAPQEGDNNNDNNNNNNNNNNNTATNNNNDWSRGDTPLPSVRVSSPNPWGELRNSTDCCPPPIPAIPPYIIRTQHIHGIRTTADTTWGPHRDPLGRHVGTYAKRSVRKPSYPALYHEVATYTWNSDDGRCHMGTPWGPTATT